jgi:integrase
LHTNSADQILREAFELAGIEEASTHSFRRTTLTQMSNAGIPLRIIQEISGHSNLEQLQRYERGEAGSSQRSDRESFYAFLHGATGKSGVANHYPSQLALEEPNRSKSP